ncbi:MAG: hypothetical protein GSR84_00265 [Desulfurococcales archaeon]|nr:hypothetical protein [Desulfurococcales archaeon]
MPVDWEALKEYHTVPVWIAGRLHARTYLRLRAKRVRAKGREYVQYYISVPKPIAEALAQGEPPEPGSDGTLLTIYAAPSPWYHALDWSSLPMRDLPERIEKEIKALRLHELGKPLALIPADPDKLRQLGLDPSRPLTLEDLVEAVKRKVLAEAQSPTH